MAEKGGFKHFMLKEIYEQPRAVRDTTLGRVSLDSGKVFLEEMEVTDDELRKVQKINIAACGTSWHAALAGKYMIERLARIPVEVDYASEWRYRDPITSSKEITLLITQSGETADTIAAQREAKAKGSKTLAICNVVGAMIAREASGTIYTHAGPEIGVASTKAFTAQLTALFLLALYLGELRGATSTEEAKKYIDELLKIPHKLESLLVQRQRVRRPGQAVLPSAGFSLPGPRHSLPDRSGRRAEAQGNLLHPRGRLSRGRDEARPQRADRRKSARGDGSDQRSRTIRTPCCAMKRPCRT